MWYSESGSPRESSGSGGQKRELGRVDKSYPALLGGTPGQLCPGTEQSFAQDSPSQAHPTTWASGQGPMMCRPLGQPITPTFSIPYHIISCLGKVRVHALPLTQIGSLGEDLCLFIPSYNLHVVLTL